MEGRQRGGGVNDDMRGRGTLVGRNKYADVKSNGVEKKINGMASGLGGGPHVV